MTDCRAVCWVFQHVVISGNSELRHRIALRFFWVHVVQNIGAKKKNLFPFE